MDVHDGVEPTSYDCCQDKEDKVCESFATVPGTSCYLFLLLKVVLVGSGT